MNTKKIVIPGLVSGFVAFVVGSILYMNPLVSGIYSKYSDYLAQNRWIRLVALATGCYSC